MVQRLSTMLAVPVERIEESEEGIVVYVPRDQIAKAIGSSGSVVRSAELVLRRKLILRESKPG
jgi:transcription antitermination factor NusA-like protein